MRAWPYFSFAGEPINAGAIVADGRDASWPEKAVPITRKPIYEALWQAGLYSYDWHGPAPGGTACAVCKARESAPACDGSKGLQPAASCSSATATSRASTAGAGR